VGNLHLVLDHETAVDGRRRSPILGNGQGREGQT
jgi:hypothetical protein